MRARQFNPELKCPLCGINKAQHDGKKYISKEHIPPRSILKDCPNHIKVPSCKSCNQDTSDLDEHFKYSMGIYLGKKHDAKELWQSSLKTLRRRKKDKEKIIESMSKIMVPDPRGGYGYQVKIDVKN